MSEDTLSITGPCPVLEDKGNLALILRDSVAEHPERTAIVHESRRMTFEELGRRTGELADVLAGSGVRPGDAVALSCANTPAFSVAYYAILGVGAVVVPLNTMLKQGEIEYHLEDSEATAYLVCAGAGELPDLAASRAAHEAVPTCERFLVLDELGTARSERPGEPVPQSAIAPAPDYRPADLSDEETAVIIYTSGTTGRPKGAELSHRNLRANVLAGAQVFNSRRDRPDVFLCALPLFHSYGQTCIQNHAIAFGGTLVMQQGFDADEAIELISREKVTAFYGVPTMFWRLLQVADDGRGDEIAGYLRVANSGGAALALETHRRFKDRFGVTIVEGYGLSETSPTASCSRLDEEPRPGSIGRPIPGVQMKLIGDDWDEVEGHGRIGEIAIKGHNVMKGYHGRPRETAEVMRDGWFRTGDLARRDEDGSYFLVDRAKDVIIRGGFNVYPREVEEHLMTHPAVSLVAVVGVPHSALGEEVKAVVVRQAGDATTGEELMAWCRETMAAYKCPRIVDLVESLPTGPTGKILKRELS
jgi:long-chain acyl-CoA synthetase